MTDPDDVAAYDALIARKESRLANVRNTLNTRQSQLSNLEAMIRANERQVFLLEQDLASLRKMREDAAS
jgi:chromosome segregation ATPase